jgi:Fe-S cluster assembly scaffold protein SufB
MIITQIFIEIDDFMKEFEKNIQSQSIANGKTRNRKGKLSMSEVMSILVYFNIQNFQNFKDYYLKYICVYYRDYFPDLISYNRFVELIPRTLLPLSSYMKQCRLGINTGISFIDSTIIPVCHNKRIPSHKVFKDIAQRGKSTMGWFYGFKLHLIINEFGEIVNFVLSSGNKDDRNQSILEKLTNGIKGKLIGDKGYISKKLTSFLYDKGIQLITKVKKNMDNKLLSSLDKLLLSKRGVIESVNDQIKNLYNLVHTRHRSPVNAMVHWISTLIAYSYRSKKPSIVASEERRIA